MRGGQGRGGGTGRGGRGGQGMGGGRGPGRGGIGPEGTDECVCPACGATVPHQRGIPCSRNACPNCGTPMLRK